MLKWILSAATLLTIGCVDPHNVNATALPQRIVTPKTTADFAKSSTKILNLTQDAGGSGVIISSDILGSRILTNKHVCELVQTGGVVKTHSLEAKVQSYIIYPKHDLCMIKVTENLNINIPVADEDPVVFKDIKVSGHPALLPHVLSTGHLSERRNVSIMIDTIKCDGTEKQDDIMYCIYLGGVPVIKDFDSQLVTALIMSGSSGSGVFNEKGELFGLVFAGSGDGLSYGSIVPYQYVRDFLDHIALFPAVTPDATSKPKNFFKVFSKAKDLCATRNPKIRKLCNQIRFQPIWQQ
jgi:S1-C subfamily serine protease